MNSQEQINHADVKPEEHAANRRQFIKGAGIAAPVVMTLSSRSVFGAECLSQQMSGNMSQTGQGSCVKGLSPGAWKTPKGDGKADISGLSVPTVLSQIVEQTVKARLNNSKARSNNSHDAVDVSISFVITNKSAQSYIWEGTPFKYGDLNSFVINVTSIKKDNQEIPTDNLPITITKDKPPYFKNDQQLNLGSNTIPAPEGKNCDDYTGGDTFQNAFGSGSTDPMRQILCDDSGSEDFHLVAAMLNAHYFSNYILSVDQVKDLNVNRTAYPESYKSLNDFLDSTWK